MSVDTLIRFYHNNFLTRCKNEYSMTYQAFQQSYDDVVKTILKCIIANKLSSIYINEGTIDCIKHFFEHVDILYYFDISNVPICFSKLKVLNRKIKSICAPTYKANEVVDILIHDFTEEIVITNLRYFKFEIPESVTQIIVDIADKNWICMIKNNIQKINALPRSVEKIITHGRSVPADASGRRKLIANFSGILEKNILSKIQLSSSKKTDLPCWTRGRFDLAIQFF